MIIERMTYAVLTIAATTEHLQAHHVVVFFPGNTNPYIWSAWGWLEFKAGHVDRARKLFDAAIVVDDTHACAWHKWGMLEKSQGNYPRARDLWMQVGISRIHEQSVSTSFQNALFKLIE